MTLTRDHPFIVRRHEKDEEFDFPYIRGIVQVGLSDALKK
jgi:hypothetical protein